MEAAVSGTIDSVRLSAGEENRIDGQKSRDIKIGNEVNRIGDRSPICTVVCRVEDPIGGGGKKNRVDCSESPDLP